MRIASYNIAGAFVPGRRPKALQRRAWHRLAALGIELAFVQEAEGAAIPAWATEQWRMVRGKLGEGGKSIDWGSVIAAAPRLQLRARRDWVEETLWIRILQDYVVLGEITLPDGEDALVASAHALLPRTERALALEPAR